MVLTTLSRTVARSGVLGRLIAKKPKPQPPVVPLGAILAARILSTSGPRLGGDYNYNLGIPGSRIKNPDPENYNDIYPGMGPGWWTLIILSFCSFFYGHTYDTSRPVNISIGIFGPNLPL